MTSKSLFWQMASGELPPPRCSQLLGAKFLRIDAEAGEVEVQFEGKPEFTNPIGHIQGGILAAMLDDTMGPAVVCMLPPGEFAPTLNLTISFERPAKLGTLIGKARVSKRGRQACFVSGALFQDGVQVATATATALVQPMGV